MGNPNWGGKRTGAGRPRQFVTVKVPAQAYEERSERQSVTPESDLTMCLAEVDGRHGVVVGNIWYGPEEASAIAKFIIEHTSEIHDR